MAAPALQNYDPTSPTPYQAPQMPEPTPAMPSPIPTEMPQVSGAVKPSGAIATIADGILRGFMQGRAYHQARQVLQLKKKSDDLQNSYNQDAVRLYQLTQAGVDPNSAEYKAAKSSVDGSWGALMDFYGQHVEAQQQAGGKKKSKMQKVEGGIMGMLQSKDPMQVSQAWYQVARKTGPPIYGQLAALQTPEAQAGRQARGLAAQNVLTHEQAQATYDKLAGRENLTPQEKEQLANAEAVLRPIRQSTATKMYVGPDGQREWYIPGEEPPGYTAVQTGTTRLYEGPNGDKNWFIPGSEPEGWKAVEKPVAGPKPGSFGDFFKTNYGGRSEDYLKARRAWALAGHVAGGGRGGGGDNLYIKHYNEKVDYYRKLYPNMPDDEVDALARRTVEGASGIQAGQVGFDAATQPQQFDSDVLGMAIDNLRKQPQWANAKNANGDPLNLDDALANIVGLGDNGYQYHTKDQLGAPTDGKYSGAVTADQLKQLERDLQTQVRIVLSRQTGLPPDQKRAAAQRMAPLFGPAAQYGPTPAVPGRGTSPASPPAAAAPTPAPASSPAPAGGLPQEARAHLKHGVVTTFGNGQEWTLDENGNPKRVK